MKKTILISLLLVIALLLPACSKTEIITETVEKNFVCSFVVTQVNEDQKLNVAFNTEANVSKLEVLLTHGEQIVSEKTFSGEELSEKSVVVDAYYGKHNLQLKAYTEDGLVAENKTEVAISASEYIIAPISGSMPQLYFTLNIKEITQDGNIPAFVWLARPESWNWDNLPTNVYAMPTVSLDSILNGSYEDMINAADAYIKELYSINPGSTFNLYINDYNSYLYLKLLTANGIPESNYYVTLLSDGGASYKAFNEAFNPDDEAFDADAKYADMAEKLNTLYNEVATVKDYDYSGNFTVNTSEFRQYAYVAAKEKSNVEWWILRPRDGVLCSPDAEFINTVLTTDKTEGIIEERNFANPLKAMIDEEKAELKALYNFNNEMFNDADEQGKKAMMILGSWATAENEPDFESYVKLVKAYYGDEFVYYYKGHPNTPTSNYPEKQAQLEELGLIDVESSINAELILFFYPDIYMCGYNSSTFLSVESKEMACAIFNMTAEAAEGNESMSGYKDLIALYTSKIDSESDYAFLCGDAIEDCFLVEFNDYVETEAEFAIFNAKDSTFTYFTSGDNGFEKIA